MRLTTGRAITGTLGTTSILSARSNSAEDDSNSDDNQISKIEQGDDTLDELNLQQKLDSTHKKMFENTGEMLIDVNANILNADDKSLDQTGFEMLSSAISPKKCKSEDDY
uniref:Uncharacterized protein n=1 Tax=Euplotes harpa TaxID=151035 RepID=A0A7S3IZR5_9SPIT|mmetsp:Transcript_11765/g.13353  ORF Transcript_11765/g.13353 Transcript_11765/m.13353 type:complete len:110 (+) Transcript_11765:78-407(+)